MSFAFVDVWRINGASLLLSRNVVVKGSDPNAGFFSAVRLATAPTVKWEDATYFVPGLFYGENRGGPVRSPGPAREGKPGKKHRKPVSLRQSPVP